MQDKKAISASYEEEDTCALYEEEDTCASYEEDTCLSYARHDETVIEVSTCI